VIPIPNIFPPAPNTISGDNVTANRLANSPQLLARAMREFSSYRYIGGILLPARVLTDSGSINFELVGEAITANDALTQVAPGSEYQLTQAGNGTISTAAVAKWGKDAIITDESIARLSFAAVQKTLGKLVNSSKLLIDTAVVSAVNTSIDSNTQAVTSGRWDDSDGSTAPKILLDVMTAAAAIRNRGLGYEADILLVTDAIWPYLAADATIQAAMAREDRSNPIYTGRFPVLAGLEVMAVPAANLPGGASTAAFVLDRGQLGFILTENLGGGYMSGGDLVETKSWRTEETDGVRIRARANFKAVITDPLACQRITGVAA
jgi:hypothetical protein